MKPAPGVSVVVPAYNAAATIAATMNGLRAQTGPVAAQAEIIVVDNASSDKTAAIARGLGVSVVDEATPGPSAARNRGLRLATGEIVCHVDADAVPSRRWLCEIVKPFADPTVVIVGGRTESYPLYTPARRYSAASGRAEPETNVNREVFAFVPSQNMAVRRAAALAVGGWAEDMASAEDVDFCHRILKRHPSGRMVYAPRAIVLHAERASDNELRDQAWSYGQGAAHMYLRYPNEIAWDARKTMHLLAVLTRRAGLPAMRRVAGLFAAASPQDVEFAVYQRMWTWWWWRGFFSMYRSGKRRPRA